MNWNRGFLELMNSQLPAIWEEAVTDRRYLHMHPEVGFDTQNTEKYVTESLEKLDVEFDKMCYVGDNTNKDFVAPEKLGMRSIWFRNLDGLYVK